MYARIDFSVSMEMERAVDMERELSLLLPSLSPSLTVSDERDGGDPIVSSVKCHMNKYSLSLINGTSCDLTNWVNLAKTCLAHISS